MTEVKIQELTEEYIDDVYLVGELSFHFAWSKSEIKKELTNELAKYFIAVVDNKAVAFGGMWIIAGEANITNIAVHPDYRGKKLGKQILSSMIKHCKDNAVPDMTLEVRFSNIIAQNLYKSLGFKDEGIRKSFYSDNNEDAIIMWKRDM